MATQEARMRALAQRIGQETKAIRALIPASSGGGTAAAQTPSNTLMQGYKAMTLDPAMLGSTFGQVNLTHAVKLHTPTDISISTLSILRDTQGAGQSGYYMALYDTTGAKLGQTGELTASMFSSSQLLEASLGASYTVPAGFFYVGIRYGTASTTPSFVCSSSSQHWRINAGLTWNTNVAASNALAPRIAVPANSWSGATAPATLGLLNGNEYRYPWVGVR